MAVLGCAPFLAAMQDAHNESQRVERLGQETCAVQTSLTAAPAGINRGSDPTRLGIEVKSIKGLKSKIFSAPCQILS